MTAAAPPLLVPGPLRRPVALLVTVAAATFAVLAARYAGTSSAGGVDARVDAVVDRCAHQWLVRHAMALGSPPSVVGARVRLVGDVPACSAGAGSPLLAVVGPGLTGVCTTLCKPLLGRTIDGRLRLPQRTHRRRHVPRPHHGVLADQPPAAEPWRGARDPGGGGLVVGGGVGAAMVASNVHYPTDTLGGFCTAVVMVCGSALLLDRLPSRQPPRHAA